MGDSGHISVQQMVDRQLGVPSRILTTHCDTLRSTHGDATGGLFRWRGRAVCAGEIRPWSAVLKILRWRAAIESEPDSARYWKREYFVYLSQLPDSLPPATLGGPRTWALEDRGKEAWIWMEDLGTRVRRSWDLGHYREAARRIGLLNGAYLAGRPLPDHAWLLRSWFPSWFGLHRKLMHLVRTRPIWRVPPASAWLAPRRRRLRLLWERRQDLLAILEAQPRTFCHRDLNPTNLFWLPEGAPEPRLLALDWHTAGEGVAGEDLASLVAGSVVATEWSWQRIAELEAAAFPAYATGLAEAGARVDPATLRRCYAAAMALRWGFSPMGSIGGLFEQLARSTAGAAKSPLRPLRKLTALHDHVLALGEEALS